MSERFHDWEVVVFLLPLLVNCCCWMWEVVVLDHDALEVVEVREDDLNSCLWEASSLEVWC